MTVTYSQLVSNTRMCSFARLLFRWHGSIYKLVYKAFIVYTISFYLTTIIYRFAMTSSQQRDFERFANYCRKFTNAIPLTFVLGFYVRLVIKRWWSQYKSLPWPDKVCIDIATYVKGDSDEARLIRRTLARYLNLMTCLTLQNISMQVKKRFPTLEHLQKAGLLTTTELKVLNETITNSPHGTWWLPGGWFCALGNKAVKDGFVDGKQWAIILQEMINHRNNCRNLFAYDWISVPLVYTQVVTMATYLFFCACLFGRQNLITDNKENLIENTNRKIFGFEHFLPIYTLVQYLIYMGWLKVAEQLINPFGEDDDDFETNYIIDRNINASYLIVDSCYDRFPELERDLHWDEKAPLLLGYTKASLTDNKDTTKKRASLLSTFLGSTGVFASADQQLEPTPAAEEVKIANISTSESVTPITADQSPMSSKLSETSGIEPNSLLLKSKSNKLKQFINRYRQSSLQDVLPKDKEVDFRHRRRQTIQK